MFDLHGFLELKKYPLQQTKLHVIRGKSATPTWGWRGAAGGVLDNLLDFAMRETCCNDLSRWKAATHIPVLLQTDVPGSPYRSMSDAYLFLGVLKKGLRRDGFGDAQCGTMDDPAWEMTWVHIDGVHLLVNPKMKLAPHGWDYWAVSKAENTNARQFSILGRADERVSIITPGKLRGFQLAHSELVDRIDRPNWIEFLDAAGIYLIQVWDPAEDAFRQYVGKAKRFSRRWRDYVLSEGTGATDGVLDDGNKHLVALRESMTPAVFLENWRIQVVRVCDTDEIDDLEREVKLSLCTYHPSVPGEDFRAYRSRFGLNGN